MPLMLVLVFSLFLSAFYGTHKDNDADIWQARGAVIAQQMLVEQSAARRACQATVCAIGVINSSAQLPEVFAGNPPFVTISGESAPRMRSYFDGTWILTVYTEPGASTWTGPVNGQIETQLAQATPPAFMCNVGYWNGSTQKVVLHGYRTLVAPSCPPQSFPGGFVGVTLPDGIPVMLTKLLG